MCVHTFHSEAIKAGIQNLTEHSPGGNTKLAPGLGLVCFLLAFKCIQYDLLKRQNIV